MALDPRTPVLVGVGVVQQREDEPEVADDALGLMVTVVRRAAADAGAPALAKSADVISVPRGTWGYRDPGRMIAEQVGAGGASTLVAELGVLQQRLFSHACAAIAAGSADVAIVCGGEAKYRALRAQITGREAPETPQDAPDPPTERLVPGGDIINRLEIDRGLGVPARQYAIIETALRAAQAQPVAEHAAELDRLWLAFRDVAAANPYAWNRSPAVHNGGPHGGPGGPDSPLFAYPYTKLHCSQWNVDQAAALILCSVEAARRHGVPSDRWVFPVASAESDHMVSLSARAEMHRSPGFAAVSAALRDATGLAPADVAHHDLYSCFPAAVRVQAREFGLTLDRPLTVTGGMALAGGPLNNYVLQSTAAMAGVLRADPGSAGLVTSVSGMLTKQGAGLWSTRPPADGFTAVDVTAETIATTATVPVVDDPDGIATIAGYTVAHRYGEPVSAIAVARLPDGTQTAVVNEDRHVLTAMTIEDWCGREVGVRGSAFRP
jgi:acetyl-CoA C-acetyltransferase